jgi:succinate dehydrogenase cytochrome b556 subunit
MYRPLSPHIFIYKAQWNTITSVLHRFTGIYLSLCLILLIFFFKFVIYHINFYSIYFLCFYFNTFFVWLIISCFFVLLVSFFFHLFGGLRHLIWDLGFFLTKEYLNPIAYLSILLTFICLFCCIYLLS